MPGFRDYFPFSEFEVVLGNFIENSGNSDPSEVLSRFQSLRSQILKPNPFQRRSKSSNDRFLSIFFYDSAF